MFLITGAGGQLGSELKKFYNDKEAVFKTSQELDITNLDQCESVREKHTLTGIINCAAYTKVDKAETEQAQCFSVNELGAENLAKLSAKCNIPLIHISTDYVFDGTSKKPYQETDPVNPQSVYGESKLAGERQVLVHAKTAIIIRTAWVYSEYGNNFVKTMLRLGAERESLNVVDDQMGSPTYAYDIAQAIYKIMPQMNENEKAIYHFTNEGSATWCQFAEKIFANKGLSCKANPIPTEGYPTPAKRPKYSVLDTTKIKQRFNLTISDWQEALDRCITRLS